MTEIKRFKLNRDGQKDLAFEGIELAEASSWEHQGPNNTRWTELSLYRTKGGKYVLHNCYITRWQGEEDQVTAEVFDSVEDLMAEITDEDGGIGNLRKELIREAEKMDEAFEETLVERVE